MWMPCCPSADLRADPFNISAWREAACPVGVDRFRDAECAQEVLQRPLGTVKKKHHLGFVRRSTGKISNCGIAQRKFIKRLQSVCLAALLC
jgi:hypothetical protein